MDEMRETMRAQDRRMQSKRSGELGSYNFSQSPKINNRNPDSLPSIKKGGHYSTFDAK